MKVSGLTCTLAQLAPKAFVDYLAKTQFSREADDPRIEGDICCGKLKRCNLRDALRERDLSQGPIEADYPVIIA